MHDLHYLFLSRSIFFVEREEAPHMANIGTSQWDILFFGKPVCITPSLLSLFKDNHMCIYVHV